MSRKNMVREGCGQGKRHQEKEMRREIERERDVKRRRYQETRVLKTLQKKIVDPLT